MRQNRIFNLAVVSLFLITTATFTTVMAIPIPTAAAVDCTPPYYGGLAAGMECEYSGMCDNNSEYIACVIEECEASCPPAWQGLCQNAAYDYFWSVCDP